MKQTSQLRRERHQILDTKDHEGRRVEVKGQEPGFLSSGEHSQVGHGGLSFLFSVADGRHRGRVVLGEPQPRSPLVSAIPWGICVVILPHSLDG